eukprot:1159514-Pelagomonas_calceolata.AAC.4
MHICACLFTWAPCEAYACGSSSKRCLAWILALDIPASTSVRAHAPILFMQIPKTGKGKKGSRPVNKDRFVNKMFLRGDSVVLILWSLLPANHNYWCPLRMQAKSKVGIGSARLCLMQV